MGGIMASGMEMKSRSTKIVGGLIALVLGASCGQVGSPAGPSGTGSSGVGLVKNGAPVQTDATTISFSGFDASTLTVTINTLTTSSVGQPYIDDGKIQLEILVDATGHPVPFGTVGATYVRFDTYGGGGAHPSSGVTSTAVDLDNLETTTGGVVKNAACGQSISFQAHYVTGGGATKVGTHVSAETPYDIVCPGGCTLGQGYWEHSYSASWPASVISGGMLLYLFGSFAKQQQNK